MHKITVVAGAQYGSEAKGHVTAQFVKQYVENLDETPDLNIINVRVAGPNAGHTVVDAQGHHIALRQIPVGAAISDGVVLYIGPGSEVDLPVVLSEIATLRELGHRVGRLYISDEATLLEQRHIDEEKNSDLTERLGSTSKGIGAARADRIWRKAKRVGDNPETVRAIRDAGAYVISNLDFWEMYPFDDDTATVIEGTQGYGLGLHAGAYPYCTSSDTRAIDFIAMSGHPHPFTSKIEVVLVARMFPIRVAGNSGAIEGETSWEDLGLPEERTTVTQKVRRVGEWDTDLVRTAVIANGGEAPRQDPVSRLIAPSQYGMVVVITMVDQKWPLLEGLSGTFNEVQEAVQGNFHQDLQWRELIGFVTDLAHEGIPVAAVTTSASTIIINK